MKRWIEIVELQLKARGTIRPGGNAVIQQEGTILNMVLAMAQDMRDKGYMSQDEYIASADEVLEAEVIEEGEPENKSPLTFR